MKPKHIRTLNLMALLTIAIIGVVLIVIGFRDNIVFFITPGEITSKHYQQRKVRIGGIVIGDSITKYIKSEVKFAITDYSNTVYVTYRGILPDLFRAQQGIVVEGKLKTIKGKDCIVAQRVLAKHDENYRAPEIADKLDAAQKQKLQAYIKQQKNKAAGL